MYVMHIALGGCLCAGPIEYGATEDTGGHIAYLLGATRALAQRADIARIDIVTRAFTGPGAERRFDRPEERLDDKRRILRLRGATSAYLEKEALAAELPNLTRALLSLLERGPRPDFLHAHFADAARMAADIRAETGIPFLYSPHSLGMQKSAAGGWVRDARLEREYRAIEQADAIVCSSRDEAESQVTGYLPAAGGRVLRASPGVEPPAPADMEAARRLIAPFLRDPDKPILLAIARPVEKKNLGTLVSAFAGAPALREAANLVILAGQRDGLIPAGEAVDEGARVLADLFDRVDRGDLWGQVALPRRHDAAEVQGLYALAARDSVFVNPALHEPFGLTILEALDHGVPVVATERGGPGEILRKAGYGITVDPTDEQAIAEACATLLRDPDRSARTMRAKWEAALEYGWPRWAEDVVARMKTLASPVAAMPAVLPATARLRRLFVSDLDATLTGSRTGVQRLTEHLAARPDMAFSIATGRSISEARRVMARWSLPEPEWLITSVGSEIWHRDAPGRYVPERGYADRIREAWQRDAILALLVAEGFPLQAAHEQRAFKLSLHGNIAMADRVAARLRLKGLPARVIPSHGRFIDILPARAGKAPAAAWLAERLSLGAEAVIAAGDSGNDRDLLEWAGGAIVPANGLDEIGDLERPHVYRSLARHAVGVVEGLAHMERRAPRHAGTAVLAAE